MMKLKFPSGNFQELKDKLQAVVPANIEWKEINPGTHQAKIENNQISVSYYQSTGTILVQGKPVLIQKYELEIENILSGSNTGKEQDDTASHALPAIVSEEQPRKKEVITGFLNEHFKDSEIVIGLVGAVGVQYAEVKKILEDRLKMNFGYAVHNIIVSKSVIESLPMYVEPKKNGQYERIINLMNFGNQARKEFKNNAVLALGAAAEIKKVRQKGNFRTAFIVDSIKHPEEVKVLREIYGQGFYLVGVFSDINSRTKYLTKELQLTPEEAVTLILKDENDADGGHGQHTSDTYHLADFFVEVDFNNQKLKESLFRFLDIVFGHPYMTPLFGEYAMFMAFTSSLRSADLSRQVGAVLTHENEIIATGANDIPKHGGGLYWPYFKDNEYKDYPEGRDYKRGKDSNIIEKRKIIEEIIKDARQSGIEETTLRSILEQSRLKDLIEFGRVVHAEMETLMMCARNNISARHSVLYCTTFPCHNCAKHIVAAGVERVVYIEPYPKSKAIDFHSESIKMGFKPKEPEKREKVTYFQPFIGIGPRKFFDLFSINLGSGRTIKRKDSDGNILPWEPKSAKPKIQLFPISYIERENSASLEFASVTKLYSEVGQ